LPSPANDGCGSEVGLGEAARGEDGVAGLVGEVGEQTGEQRRSGRGKADWRWRREPGTDVRSRTGMGRRGRNIAARTDGTRGEGDGAGQTWGKSERRE